MVDLDRLEALEQRYKSNSVVRRLLITDADSIRTDVAWLLAQAREAERLRRELNARLDAMELVKDGVCLVCG